MEIKIAIATNINFYEKTLPIIIPSLVSVGIENKNIHVFNSGFDKYESEIIDGITYHKLNHNSYEYSPLIEISEKQIVSDYWFLIHDTCKVGSKFKELLYNIPNENTVKIALKSKPAMSIGLYKYDYLITLKNKLLSIKNINYSSESLKYWKKWGVSNEDFILWMTEPQPYIYNNTDSWFIVDYSNWYNTKTIRRTEYYPSLDLYKNKSNWGQTGENMITVV
jgi:hypothetical protein